RRDSTASQPGRRRRTATDSSVPGVSSPLAPMQPVQQSADPASAPVPAARPESTLLPSDSTNLLVSQTSGNDNKTQPHDLSGGVPPSSTTSTLAQQRLSTAEILKQVTAAVDGLGFDDYEVCDADMAAPEPSAASAGTLAAGVVTQDAPGDAAQAPKTVVHKKSASWWQWGAREDSVQAESEQQQQQQQHQQQQQQQPVPVQVSRPKETVSKEQAETAGASRNKLPSPISFLRFNRKSKKERKGTEEPQRSASPQPPRQPQQPPQPPQQQVRQDADSASDASSDTSEPPPPPVAAPVAASAAGAAGAKPGHSNIPSIITPVRPAPTARAGANSRLPIHIERAIYRLASIKLANPRRPLLQQVLLSNMMFWYLELINPRSQPAQVQQPITPNNHQQSQQQQQQQQNHQHQQQNHHQQKQQHQQKQHQQQQQQKQHDAPASDRRGKRANNHKNSKDGSKGRRASGGTSSSERVVRTPQYERQQQQIYLNGGPPPQQHYVHVQSYGRHAVEQQEPDEDDDVPLALYRVNEVM
ncbi:hypothetical protein IW150_001332, partial [Coemansia sp. RSA 2607]